MKFQLMLLLEVELSHAQLNNSCELTVAPFESVVTLLFLEFIRVELIFRPFFKSQFSPSLLKINAGLLKLLVDTILLRWGKLTAFQMLDLFFILVSIFSWPK